MRNDQHPQPDTSPEKDRGVSISRTTWLWFLLLFGPVVLLVAMFRLLEFSFVTRMQAAPLGLLFSSAAMIPAVLLVMVAAVFLWFRLRWPHIRISWHLVAISFVTAGLFILLYVVAPPWTKEWISPRAYEAIRWDILILMLVGLAFLFLMEYTRGWPRTLSLVVLYCVVLLLMVLPATSFFFFLSTGTPADSTLIKYFLVNISDAASVASSEIKGAKVLFLLAPLAFLMLPVFLLRLPVVSRWITSHSSPRAVETPWHVMAGMLPLLLLLTVPPRTPIPVAHQRTSYIGLVNGLVSENAVQIDFPFDKEIEPPFDTKNMRFVPTDSTRRMNVVVIVMESTRARSVTPYDTTLATTPFLNSLASQGLLVEKMYAVTPFTNKALTPLMTGIYPYPHREIVEAVPGGVPGKGLPALLKPLGYRTAFFTPATLSYERKDRILANYGFEDFHGDASFDKEGFEETNYFGYEDRIVLQPSMAWIDKRLAADEPFFLSYLTLVSHHPYKTPSWFSTQSFDTTDETLDLYLNTIHYTDRFIQELFQSFEERGLLENTLFFIVGDHGQAFGEHVQKLHADVPWDEVLQVPAILYSPTLFPQPGRIQGNRQQIDLLPTIADALNLDIEGGHFPGQSLLQPVPDQRTLFHSCWESNICMTMRQDSLKFIYRFDREAIQVFDLKNDPFETQDLNARLTPEERRQIELKILFWRSGVMRAYEGLKEKMAEYDPYAR